MLYQQSQALLTLQVLEEFKRKAKELISESEYFTAFEKERLDDFIDEVEDFYENFHDYKEKIKMEKLRVELLRSKQRSVVLESSDLDNIRNLAKDTGLMFIDSNDDLVIIIKKEDRKNLLVLFEKLALISSAVCGKTLKEASEMLNISKRAMHFLRKKYGFN